MGLNNDISIISIRNPEYPVLLKESLNPPPLIYYRGTLPKCGVYIAIVGSRKPNEYGRRVVEHIITSLKNYDACIVSGLAYGIDSYAHIYALQNGLKTIGVLGTGVDTKSIYPKEHLWLVGKMTRNASAVISQFPTGTCGSKYSFPKRNCVIAGLSHATIVIQANEKSGSLITAHAALENNREVYAVPGSIFDPLSFGTNSLIAQGAKPIYSVDDFLADFSVFKKAC